MNNIPYETALAIGLGLDQRSAASYCRVSRSVSGPATAALYRNPAIRERLPGQGGVQDLGRLYSFARTIIHEPGTAGRVCSVSFHEEMTLRRHLGQIHAISQYTPPGDADVTRWVAILEHAGGILSNMEMARWKLLLRGSRDAVIALVLLHLPNLGAISIETERALQITGSLLSAASDPSSTSSVSLRPKSLRIRIAPNSPGWTAKPRLADMYIRLPGLTHLQLNGFNIEDIHLRHQQTQNSENMLRSGSLAALDVSGCLISCDTLADIVEHCPRLQVLRAMNIALRQPAPVGLLAVLGTRMDGAYYVINDVLKASKPPLRELTLREPHDKVLAMDDIDPDACFDGLSTLTSLRLLRVGHQLLQFDLAATLPTSLRRIDLDARLDPPEDLEDLCLRLVALAGAVDTFPVLRNISIYLYPPADEDSSDDNSDDNNDNGTELLDSKLAEARSILADSRDAFRGTRVRFGIGWGSG